MHGSTQTPTDYPIHSSAEEQYNYTKVHGQLSYHVASFSHFGSSHTSLYPTTLLQAGARMLTISSWVSLLLLQMQLDANTLLDIDKNTRKWDSMSTDCERWRLRKEVWQL
jgi:hypothetical protein